MSGHLLLTLLNPAFKEEVGTTVDTLGNITGFTNSSGAGRAIHAQACQPLPEHLGLHSITGADEVPDCEKCKLWYALFVSDNGGFHRAVNAIGEVRRLAPLRAAVERLVEALPISVVCLGTTRYEIQAHEALKRCRELLGVK